mmetsp:Transcript_11683/g.17961  ORF Transcript_11683/g.17961 Transcript_11683/m.17961 type:complete len:353 (+) Transcript_11683:170-1228(+)
MAETTTRRRRDDRIPKPGKPTKVFESPRRHGPDNQVLIPPEFLQDRDCRHQYQQFLASDHCQDSTVLDLTSRSSCFLLSPSTLKAGIPPGHAKGIRTLKLWVGEEEFIDSWIDAITSLFPSLTEIWISPTPELARMRRHYILYQMPNLKIIDGIPVTELEREAAGKDHVNSISIKEQQQKQEEELEKKKNNNNKKKNKSHDDDDDEDAPAKNNLDDTVLSETNINNNNEPEVVPANTVNDGEAVLSSENNKHKPPAESLNEEVDIILNNNRDNKVFPAKNDVDKHTVVSFVESKTEKEQDLEDDKNNVSNKGEKVPSVVASSSVSSSSSSSSSKTKKVPPPSSFGHGKVADI